MRRRDRVSVCLRAFAKVAITIDSIVLRIHNLADITMVSGVQIASDPRRAENWRGIRAAR